MRGLGYPRIISIENFRRPNFELVADILYWLAQKYDPHVEISDNIDEEVDKQKLILIF
jgi:clusterin-associated protein 1